MIGIDAAIRRLAFAEARQSSAEAMANIAAHRQQIERAAATRDLSEEQQAAAFAEQAEALRRVDKKA
jgi:hypothetical protein